MKQKYYIFSSFFVILVNILCKKYVVIMVFWLYKAVITNKHVQFQKYFYFYFTRACIKLLINLFIKIQNK